MNEIGETNNASEILRMAPEGLFIYFPKSKNPELIRNQLVAALPGRKIIVDPQMFDFPQDFGVKRHQCLCLSPQGYDRISKMLPQALGIDWEVIGGILPEIKTSETYSFVGGGREIEIAGSQRVYSLNNDVLIRALDHPAHEFLKDGSNIIPCSSIAYAILELCKSLPDGKNLYYGHLDLLMSGCNVGGVEKLYMDELLYGYAKSNDLLDACLSHAQPVDHSFVVRGGLNIEFVDRTALIPSESTVPLELLNNLIDTGFNIVALGEEEFSLESRAGVRCRSLSLNWKTQHHKF